MVKPDFFIRRMDARNENEIFNKLYFENQKTNNSDLTLYLPEIFNYDDQTYAFFKQRYDLIATRFEMADEVFYFADDEDNDIEYLTIDEINLLRSMGKLSIDGAAYKIIDAKFELIDTSIGAQRLFTFKLEEDNQ